MATEQGFSNQKKKGGSQYKTIHALGSNSYGPVVGTKGLLEITAAKTISAVDDIIGIDGQVQLWKVTIASHGASAGDVLKMATGNIVGFEFEVISVLSSSELTILPISNTKPVATETASISRWGSSKISATGAVTSTLSNVVDSGNSSTTPLGISGVFTGAAFDITDYASVSVFVASNVDSAASGLTMQFSTDGTNWDHSHSTTYTSGGKGYIFNCEGKFARVVFTNGAVAQTSFRLQTIFKTIAVPSSQFTLSQSLSSNMFAQVNRSVISGETTAGGGGYVNVKVNPSGALTVENTPSKQTPSYQEIVNLTNVAQTFTAPTDARWCKIQADSTNTAIIRVKIGGTATVSSGLQFAAGKTEDYWAVGNISVICETAATNQKIYVQFGV